MAFTVACAQFAPQKAKVPENLDRIADLLLQSSGEGADLVVFPETCTSGYFVEGGVAEVSLSAEKLEAELTRRLAGRLNRHVDCVVGFYEQSEGTSFNSAAYLEFRPSHARTSHVYRKFFLPTYGVFDEQRFVGKGTALGKVETRFGGVGILICEDVWHSLLGALLAMSGATLMVVPSASPARDFSGERIGNLDRYRRMLRALSEEHGVWSINCQLSGFEGGKGFVGGSLIVDPLGNVVAESPIQEDHILLAQIDPELGQIARANTPLFDDLRSNWCDLVEIARSLGP
ncbi:MAG: hypothetical protein AMXMBFR19_03240 [Chthonomonadaceae bacterium]|uniref:Amidohydrolase n=1 Tax=Candidatus Nitrosymbiomonas proteolyticus TaxID=2608984 RepID=A0A809S3C7_9BACT|nr:(R)-stereoselective amidase [Fimbriimonadaceae bacterium]MCC6351585.1 beta-ureidopropionase [Fimbriimonadaceae bacterium]MCL4283536.1 hypothetical protein [Fimbriimonadaceae bacterium]QOJ11287.1 MAG: beta-ureidopropionase [Chthonomonadaceae bacterium]BBO23087.1 amidohydrolase [Candidatus Nitrosymbiomonas proteolyticus]